MPLTSTHERRSPLRSAVVLLLAMVLVGSGCASTIDVGTAVTTGEGDVSGADAETTTMRRPRTSATGNDVARSDPAETGPATETADDRPTNDDATDGTTEGDAVTTEGPTPTAPPPASTGSPRPDWLGKRVLPTTPDGVAVAQTTPAELVRRELETVDTLPPPEGDRFEATVDLLAGDPLARSTWHAGCPVGVDELRYLQMTFWGFDGRMHRGEMIVNHAVVDDVIGVFRTLFEQRFPIEEMRIVTQADVDAPPTGDGNNTTSFVCRSVVGGSRFSEHAYGLAIDVNPFQNPYRRGEVVLPELATAYLDRAELRPGMFVDGETVVAAFDEIGWGWGGRWSSLDDYHHFALNDR